MKKIINYVLLFTLFYSCVAGDVGGDKSKDSAAVSAGASTPVNPQILVPTPATTLPLTTTTDLSITSLIFSSTISNPDSFTYTSEWFLGGVSQGTTLNSVAPLNLNPAALGVGIYVVYLEISDGAGLVYDSATWSLDVPTPAFTGFAVTSSPAATTYHAINATVFNSGGFTTNGTSNSRGTPMVVTGYAGGQDFCLRQSALGPGLVTDYKVVFLDATDTPMTPALPVGMPFAGIGTDTCLFDYSTNHLTVSFAGAPTTNKVKAVVYNTAYAANPEVTRVEWTVSVEPVNTAPTISIDAGTSTALATITQNSAAIFAITVEDKDQDPSVDVNMAVNFTINSSPLDGVSPMPLKTAATMSNCVKASGSLVAGKYQCTVTFSTFGDAGSIPDSTVYTIQATVTDTSLLTSNTVSWLAQPIEITTTPSINNVFAPGPGATQGTDTYIYDTGDNTTAINTATEGDVIFFETNVSEAERDDYTITYEYLDQTAGTYITASVSNVVTISNTTDPVATTSASFTIPQTAVVGAATSAVNFRVTVTDSPDTAAATSTSNIVAITITNDNPTPTMGAATPSPAYLSDNFISEGTGISISPGAVFSDASTADGDTIIYQWQKNVTCVAAYTNITGATSSTLTWSPDVGTIADGAVVCLRLCVGDDGFGNPADCTGLTGGTWTGSGNSFTTVVESDKQAVATSSAAHATWMDGVNQYIVTSATNNINISHNTYNAATGAYTVGATTGTFVTDVATANVLEVPYDISVVGDATFIYIAYRIEEADFFVTPTSVMRVRRVDRATLATIDTFDINIVTNKIGSISTDGTRWFLPYIDFNNSNNISFRYQTVATAGGTTLSSVSTIATDSSDLYSTYDEANAEIVILNRDTATGFYDITSLATGGAPSSPATDTNIFASALMTRISMSGARTGNLFNYVAATNAGNNVVLYRSDAMTAANSDLQNSVDDFATIPALHNVNALTIVTGVLGANHEAYVSTTVANDNYLVRLTDAGHKSSRQTNTTNNDDQSSAAGHLTVFIQENFVSGTGDDNTNDTVFSTFIDGTDTHSIIINIEDSTFTDATPFFQ
ncbi:hypothetical protein A9Q84_09475 [Halobacteriovorax marinus]|uniref:Lipoprotein n=1 Tax=Halobacteriovorax marinus TaxID=97084 RepID=A0A1Y5FC88_9BACT|nr:hypothetical protein A9Q84_09475 [Halobacteriovorax marinus]